MCVDKEKRAMPVVKWHHFGFEGKCQRIEMCHVIGDGRWSPSSSPPGPPKLLKAEYVHEVAAA